MSKIIEKSYDVIISMSAKIIHDFKINESDWEFVILENAKFVNTNIKNISYAKKMIIDQLTEVEGDFYKKYSNNIDKMPEFKKCYYKFTDWIIQLHLKRSRLMKAKHKSNVAKNILTEELLVANKFFNQQEIVNSFHLEKIIDITVKNLIK